MKNDIPREPIARETYDSFAEAYAARVRTKSHNALIERPGTLSLLPDVKGKRVLDAGCGPGVYTETLLERGAEVVAIDVSEKMIEIARRTVSDRATFRVANLEETLDFLQDEDFDLVLSSLVLDYIYDWDSLFKEYFRVLCPNGVFVFSVGHPVSDYFLPGAMDYFDIEHLVYTWTGFGEPVDMPFYRRSLASMTDPLFEAGFVLEQILEPKPVEECRVSDPEAYEKFTKKPLFICFRTRKPA